MNAPANIRTIRSPRDAAKGNALAKDLFFFDLQKAGIWIARRGMMVLSLPLTGSDLDAFVDQRADVAIALAAERTEGVLLGGAGPPSAGEVPT